MATATRWTILAAICLGCCGGCSGQGLCQRLKDDDPAVRRAAVIQAGQTRDSQAVPTLVDCLEDQESEVRFFAILALERITGTTMGYRYYAHPAERRAAVQRWRDWLASHQAVEPQWTQAAARGRP